MDKELLAAGAVRHFEAFQHIAARLRIFFCLATSGAPGSFGTKFNIEKLP